MDKNIRDEEFTHVREDASLAAPLPVEGKQDLVDNKGLPIGSTGDVGQLNQSTWSGSSSGGSAGAGYQEGYSGKEGTFTEPIVGDRGT